MKDYPAFLLPPVHLRPPQLTYRYYNNRFGVRLRYAFMPHPAPFARIIYSGGLSQPIESDYENILTLHQMGLEVYAIERFGEGGCERPYTGDDFQKPAALHVSYFAQDWLDFLDNHVGRGLPTYAMGSCYGGLVALEACRMRQHAFDKVFLVSPMFGSHFMMHKGGEQAVANLSAGENDETVYYGKATDWTPALAEKWLERDATSADPVRRMLRYWWFYHQPALRLGGFTYGRLRCTARSLLGIMAPQVLADIHTRIVIITAENDQYNDNERHQWFVKHLPAARQYIIANAGHGLWREADVYRNQLLAIMAWEMDVDFVGL